MKKSSKKTPQRKKPTWTFQPEDDVITAFDKYLKDADRGQRTEIINQALRLKLSAASISLAEEEIAALKARIEHLRNTTADNG